MANWDMTVTGWTTVVGESILVGDRVFGQSMRIKDLDKRTSRLAGGFARSRAGHRKQQFFKKREDHATRDWRLLSVEAYDGSLSWP
ncbi:hypothetical protein ACHAP8_000690, partial [Fusarium lateritium]